MYLYSGKKTIQRLEIELLISGLAVQSYLAVSAENTNISRSAFAVPYFYLVPAFSLVAFPLSSLLVVFRRGQHLGSVHANTFTSCYVWVVPLRARGLVEPLQGSGWEWSCRTGFLLSRVSVDQNFFFFFFFFFFLLSSSERQDLLFSSTTDSLAGGSHAVVPSCRPPPPLLWSYKPVNLCLPPLLSCVGSFSLYF